ncbi:MBL fold metallo-hydrolase, partial [Paenibacillus sp. TAF58]
GYELIVAHTHAHGDHIAADGQFAGRPDTIVVGTTVDDVIAFFGLNGWPEHPVVLPLGGRDIDVIPGPGHEPSAVVFFDRESGTLFTGDTVCPGRLYIGPGHEPSAVVFFDRESGTLFTGDTVCPGRLY